MTCEQRVSFKAHLPREKPQFTLELPKDFKDASGRSLRNADSFPLKVATGAMPPLAKFAAAPFGIVERFAEGPDGVRCCPSRCAMWRPPCVSKACSRARRKVARSARCSPKPTPTSLPGSTRCSATTASPCRASRRARDVKGPLPKVLDRPIDKDRCSRAWCRCCRPGRRQDAGPAQTRQQRPAPV
jgi:hypothetical protein